MMIPEPTALRYHVEIDKDEYFDVDYVDGPDGPEPVPTPEPEDLPFDAAECPLCGQFIGAGLLVREDFYGREIEAADWTTCFRGPFGPVCEDCVEHADKAVARMLVSEWLAPVTDAARFYAAQHPDSPTAAWFATNLPTTS